MDVTPTPVSSSSSFTKLNNNIITTNNNSNNSNQDDNLAIIKRSLNNLSTENAKILIDQIVSKANDIGKEAAESIIQFICEKGSKDNTYLVYYAKICSKLHLLFLQKLSLDIGNVIIKIYDQIFSILKEQLNGKDIGQSIVSTKSRIINLSRFVAECYRFHVIDVNFYVHVIREFVPRDSSQNTEYDEFVMMQIEALGLISTVVGKSIDTASAPPSSAAGIRMVQQAIEDSYERIQLLSDNKNVRAQTRYLLKNLIELKNNGWVFPSNTQAQADEEMTQREIISYAEVVAKLINKFLASKCPEVQHHSLFWRRALQGLSNTNYEFFKDAILEDRSSSPSSTPIVPLSPWLRRASNPSIKSPTTLLSPINNSTDSSNQLPMEIDDNFSLNGGGSNLIPTPIAREQLLNSSSFGSSSNDKPTNINHLLRLNLEGGLFNDTSASGSSLPSGFISPKTVKPSSCDSPPRHYSSLSHASIGSSSSPSTLSSGMLHQQLGGNAGMPLNNVVNNSHRESPELKLSGAESSDLAVIVSIIESRVVTKELQCDWRNKILKKVREMRPVMKKSNKTEILAAIWQNMCDNQSDYQLYADLCLNLIKQEEEIEAEQQQKLKTKENQKLHQQLQLQQQQQQNSISTTSSGGSNSNLSSFNLTSPSLDDNNNHEDMMALDAASKKKAANRRSSMATIQMIQQQKTLVPSMSAARRSSIAVASELTRRGSMSEDTPSTCPPAPKLKSTPTLKSVSHNPIINPINNNFNIQLQPLINNNNKLPTSTINNNNNNNNGQPNSKKLKSSNLDSFKDVLVSSLQDDLALKMFVSKRSLNVYFELLKDLYKEFIIEIPLLIKCIHLIQQGLYELSENECETLFELEEMAQQQLEATKQIEERKKLVTKEKETYQWKTGKWEDQPQDPPPPPNSYIDLKSDVFVL